MAAILASRCRPWRSALAVAILVACCGCTTPLLSTVGRPDGPAVEDVASDVELERTSSAELARSARTAIVSCMVATAFTRDTNLAGGQTFFKVESKALERMAGELCPILTVALAKQAPLAFVPAVEVAAWKEVKDWQAGAGLLDGTSAHVGLAEGTGYYGAPRGAFSPSRDGMGGIARAHGVDAVAILQVGVKPATDDSFDMERTAAANLLGEVSTISIITIELAIWTKSAENFLWSGGQPELALVLEESFAMPAGATDGFDALAGAFASGVARKLADL